jgi:TetR/AcrR family transcriptional regulator, transcriptional repressor for nem operon
MAHSQADKAKNHQRIVRSAAKRFREKGLAGIGIAGLMQAVGLTVGGFYKHFDSREALVAEALSAAFGRWQRKIEAAASSGRPLTYQRLVDEYLTETHRDNPGDGCSISALSQDIARSGKRIRALATEEVRRGIQQISGLIEDTDRRTARAKAILTFSSLVGALCLSRAVSDEKLSSEILRTVALLLQKPKAR